MLSDERCIARSDEAATQHVTAIMRGASYALAAFYLALLAAGSAAVLLGSAREGWTALLRELLPLLFMPLPAMLAPALVWHRRTALVGLVVLAVLCVAVCGPRTAIGGTPVTSGSALRVFSLNVGAARRIDHPDAVVRAVRATSPDVVCLVEAPVWVRQAVTGQIGDTYPFSASSDEIVVLSRLPLTDQQHDLLPVGAHDSLRVSVELDRRLIDLTVVHLLRADEYRGLRSGPRSALSTIRSFSTDERDDAVGRLIAQARAEPGAKLLAGDFNMTPTSRAHAALRQVLRDAFAESGWGLGHTYPSSLGPIGLGISLPLIRIDYIWYSDQFSANGAWVGPDGGSDHRPIVADLALR
jgi:endonuclease/exonuclease/phosphatase (EEP) superfamily protein YafD